MNVLPRVFFFSALGTACQRDNHVPVLDIVPYWHLTMYHLDTNVLPRACVCVYFFLLMLLVNGIGMCSILYHTDIYPWTILTRTSSVACVCVFFLLMLPVNGITVYLILYHVDIQPRTILTRTSSLACFCFVVLCSWYCLSTAWIEERWLREVRLLRTCWKPSRILRRP